MFLNIANVSCLKNMKELRKRRRSYGNGSRRELVPIRRSTQRGRLCDDDPRRVGPRDSRESASADGLHRVGAVATMVHPGRAFHVAAERIGAQRGYSCGGGSRMCD
jgi:hypothetical protein